MPSSLPLHQLFSNNLLDYNSPLVVLSPGGTSLWSNGAYRDLTADPQAGSDLSYLLPPQLQLDLEALRQSGHAHHDGIVTFKNHAHRVRLRYAPMVDSTGQIEALACLINVARDDTVSVQDLARVQSRLEDIVRLVSDWIWESTCDLTVTALSDRVFAVMGYHPQELIGKPLYEIAINRRAQQTLRNRFRSLSPFRNHVFEASDKAGQPKLLLVSSVPIFDLDNGEHLGYRGTAHDITELTEREHGLMAAKESAEQASRAKTQFLARMSHELRTPLNSIIGFSEMMRLQTHGPLGAPDYLDYAGDIYQSANRLLNVINDILDITTIEAGKLVLNETETTLKMITDPLIPAIRETAETSGLLLKTKIPDNLPHLFIDQRIARQILGNLLSNAVKFTPEGGQVTLQAALDAVGGMAISVTDTGIGIDPAALDHLFIPFFQAETGTTRKFEGTGLGLALAKRLTELLGGHLHLTSRPQQGTTVTIVLPASRVMTPPSL
ncbi:PAS domain-containing sensor histidine kinase [Dongia soli]|uniref:histidine kinase n=1 Tax=Dongia soli TaxID=600628 RepID=A0ABU5E9A6_9PROT|nr:ATP-binding protein [Dongia soli]MDY0882940.1 ATP-binding protein [Dongia soli]